MKTMNLKIVIGFMLISLITFSCNGQNAPDNNIESITEMVKVITINAKTDEQKAEAIFLFVRDSIQFGWVYPQEIPAIEVLKKRKGVCMQKTNLLVALAREAGLQARFHFMYVHKTALEDFLPDFAYKKWIDPFPHAFPEINLNGNWVSMEATFDMELHNICIKEKLNFAKYENILKEVSNEFSVFGVKGHQQYVHAEGNESFYGDDLSKFTEFMHQGVPWWKRKLQPIIFRKADKKMKELRIKNQ